MMCATTLLYKLMWMWMIFYNTSTTIEQDPHIYKKYMWNFILFCMKVGMQNRCTRWPTTRENAIAIAIAIHEQT